MPMFKDKKRYDSTDTLIGQGTHVDGTLISEAGLRIEGEYRGDIECKGDVIIGECGIARSNITARDVTVAGKVFGDITTKGRLTVTATGQLHGNVTASTLLIQDGGVFTGNCRMERAPVPEARSAAVSSTEAQQSKDGASNEKARQAG